MPKPLLIAFLLIACGGAAAGGEDYEYMPMHGNAGAGDAVGYNDFRAERPLPFAVDRDTAATIRIRHPVMEPKAGIGFMEWKNHCSVQPPIVEGQALSMVRGTDFLQVAPYISRPVAESGGFFEALGLE